MDYQKIYHDLIQQAANRRVKPILVEVHHILPKSLGGDNSDGNLVALSLREHFMAHLLLYRIYKNDPSAAPKMASAVNRMSNTGRYRITSHQYSSARRSYIENHPAKDTVVQDKIKNSLRATRLENGYVPILCKCGCGTEVGVTIKPNGKMRYAPGHRPKRYCLCGCGGEIDTCTTALRLPGHDKVKIKCACGCGEDTHRPIDLGKSIIVFKNGHNTEKNKQIGNSIRATLNAMSPDEMTNRIKKTWLSGNQSQRAESIRRGKGSQFRLELSNGEHVDFWSYDNVVEITGYKYEQIKYRIKFCDGLLPNGNRVILLFQYRGKNDK